MVIGVGIFFVDDEAVEAVGDVLQSGNLQASVVFGGGGLARGEGAQEPNP